MVCGPDGGDDQVEPVRGQVDEKIMGQAECRVEVQSAAGERGERGQHP
ncbi:hypothetical protein ABID94_006097 [Streptomyces sp. PvR018]